jgi:glycosyltransferase involved in cell wall biosynthesis
MSTPPFCIVIPAYNEELAIGRTLERILDGARPGELEIIVAANGCTDRTADVARAFGSPVTVVETEVGSKVGALNLADQHASAFPRIYMDADIGASIETMREVVRALGQPGVLAAAPRVEVDTTHASRTVRAFYRVWTNLPYFLEGMIGSGFYALSATGRARFESFPDVIADDGYVRLLFAPDERRIIESCRFTIIAPQNLSSLVKVKTRSRLGGRELRARFPEMQTNDGEGNVSGAGLRALRGRPDLWASLPAYAFVVGLTAIRCRLQRAEGGATYWERDETSRESLGG